MVVLNGIESDWKEIEAGVPQGLVLGPLLFLVYINDLAENVLSPMKLFADDSSLFSRVTDVNYTQYVLETDLKTISDWGHQWKMMLKIKQWKIFFPPRKINLIIPSSLNNIPVARMTNTKHLGIIIDEKL